MKPGYAYEGRYVAPAVDDLPAVTYTSEVYTVGGRFCVSVDKKEPGHKAVEIYDGPVVGLRDALDFETRLHGVRRKTAAANALIGKSTARAPRARRNPMPAAYLRGGFHLSGSHFATRKEALQYAERENHDSYMRTRATYTVKIVETPPDGFAVYFGPKVNAAAPTKNPATSLLGGGGKRAVVVAAQRRINDIYARGFALDRKGRWHRLSPGGQASRLYGYDVNQNSLTPVDARLAHDLTEAVAGKFPISRLPNYIWQ